MPRDPLRVHRLIDPQHIGPAGGSFLQSRLGGVVDGLAQQRQRLRLPQAAGALRQQAGLVIPPLTQAPGADRYPGHRVERSGEVLRRAPGDQLSQGRRSRGHPPELEAVEPLSGQALVPQRRRAEKAAGPPAQGVGPLRPGKLPATGVTDARSVQNTAAEGALGWEDEVQEGGQQAHRFSASASSSSYVVCKASRIPRSWEALIC